MDKLQPLIRHHFWILSALVLPLILYGYYSANGQLKAAIKAREETLDKTKSGVSSGNVANDDYIKKLKVINGFLEASVDDAIVDLWRHQQARMTWPPLVADRIPKDFLGEFDQQVPFIYKGAYEEVYRKLMERVQPVRPMDPMTLPNPKAPPAPNQKVVLMASLPQASFGQFGITSQEMWDAQIDVWMTELLLDAIVKMNRDKESVSEAVIRRLDILDLYGGTGQPVTSDAGMAGGGDMMGMEGGFGGGRSTTGPKINATVAFLPVQEFGAATDGGGGGGDMMMDMEGGFGGGSAAAPPKRYLGDPESQPFFERGFYMSVIIQQNKIADFVVQLANSDWPVQVRRFQVGVNPYRTYQVSPDMAPGGMGEFSLTDLGSTEGGSAFPMSGVGTDYGNTEAFDSGMGRGGRNLVKRPNPYATNLPKFASDAMNHPDLVRLDLAGVITMYKQPKEVIEAVAARNAARQQQAVPQSNPSAEMFPGNPGNAPAEGNPTTPATGEAPATPVEGTPATPAPIEAVPPEAAPAQAAPAPGAS